MNAIPQPLHLRASPSPGLRGQALIPGDKSISHRALILGALAEGETRIEDLLVAQDVLATAEAVRAFGAGVDRSSDGVWRVRGAPWRSPSRPIDCGNSGTGARLLMGAAAGFPIQATFTGDASLRARPMRRVIEPLQQMGARAEGDGRLPITLAGGRLQGIRHLNHPASAQVKSAILLAGLGTTQPVEIFEPVSSRDHMENMLRAFGCEIQVERIDCGRRVELGRRRRLTGTSVLVPGDPSSAAFLLVAGLIVPNSDIMARGVLINPLRTGLLATLREMGAELAMTNVRTVGGEPVADITARSSRLRGVTVPADRAPAMIDEYPILAAAAAVAEGETIMHDLAELRVKESDRLRAVLHGLRACGVEANAEGDTLRVRGYGTAPPGGARVITHGDHRIAMSFLTLGLAARRAVTVDRSEMISTSFPGFAPLMRSLGAEISALES